MDRTSSLCVSPAPAHNGHWMQDTPRRASPQGHVLRAQSSWGRAGQCGGGAWHTEKGKGKELPGNGGLQQWATPDSGTASHSGDRGPVFARRLLNFEVIYLQQPYFRTKI